MAFTQDDVRANREYLQNKLRAEKSRAAVLHAAEGEAKYDFVLLDTRGREAFAAGHIPGAWCFPQSEVATLASKLPKDREIVTYCWGHD
jgi:rhodanese-related sulfurtransferase